jgi:hypothetical protein
MTSSGNKRARGSDVRKRIAMREGVFPVCVVLDCRQPTAARAGRGLNRHYCQRHIEHYRRHGSYAKGSYTAAELAPRRKAALEWLQGHRERTEVRAAVACVIALYERSGRPEEAFRLAGKSPEERAGNVWARLRADEVDPLLVLAVWIAVELCHRADPQPERKPEYRWVQTAKLLHRMAGGSHKRWEREGADGRVHVTEMHKYPARRGRVLRHVGEALSQAASGLRPHVSAVAPAFIEERI